MITVGRRAGAGNLRPVHSPGMPDATLAPTPTLDFDSPEVAAFAREHSGGATEPREIATRLFAAVRDGVLYDPFTCVPDADAMSASATLRRGRSWCVPKAVLLAACLRERGIPARLAFADVKNHLSTPRLRELMGSDVYAWHGCAEVLLEGRWLKATPAFNARLCSRFGMVAIEFDGTRDSLLHPTDASGREHVAYVRDRGSFDDTPVDAIRATFEREYPALVAEARRRWG